MIKKCVEAELAAVLDIWLAANIQAHSFIPEAYWRDSRPLVEALLPQAEVYLYRDGVSGRIEGFIGLDGGYVAGLFVRPEAQSKGIGRQLLKYGKGLKPELTLKVYQKNCRAVAFYQREGFAVWRKAVDPATGERELAMHWSR